tara:strand:+ start:835 stop:3096 length:2262 start_codon:yes stop_codon:yes gene_type:complete
MYLNQLPFKTSILAIAVTLTACGGGSSSGGSAPSGLASNNAGTAVMSAKGGNGQHNSGDGGDVSIYKSYSDAPLNITVNGIPDASYDLLNSEVQLGTNPATISTDTTISADTSSFNAASVGTLYFYNQRIYRYDGAVDDVDAPILGKRTTIITGLQVAAGTTLSLEFTNTSNSLYFFNDVQNDGTIKVLAEEGDSAVRNLSFYPAAYYGSGSIDLSGQYPGQDGGDLSVYASIIQNSGTFNTSGADGDTEGLAGGDAGRISINSNVYIENTGNLTAEGGDSASSTAGSGENINIYGYKGVYNTGTISSNAGTGINGSTYIDPSNTYIFSSSEVINTGDITAIGSTAVTNTDVTAGGEGGEGGDVSLYVGGGEGGTNIAVPRMINTGSINVNGGNSAFDSYDAGNGGAIYIGASDSYDGGESYVNPILVAISGNLSANGGNTSATTDTGSGDAGNGGDIVISHASQIASTLATQIVGYTSIDVSGGSAHQASSGGDIEIYTESNSNDGYQTAYAPAAPINVKTNLTLNAGEVVTTGELTATPSGSRGGDLDIYIDTGFASLQKNLNIEFDGIVSSNGSDVNNGSTSRAGYAWISAIHDINVTGEFSFNGGSDNAIPEEGEDDGYNEGKQGGSISIASTFGVANVNASVTAAGGNGQIEGGNGGYIAVTSALGGSVKGNIDVGGGNASTALINDEDTLGGAGGSLYVVSGNAKAKIGAAYDIAGGTGTDAGFSGGVFLESDCLEGICGTNTIAMP